ncbi:MAG TPA: FAD-dependent thymidylate synthase [Syntrophales bacterium]|nr:FAD-dependent thymidylate synthase [Syntrophales bacterium]
MKIILAGYNLDYETIKEFQESHPAQKNLTPETVSAAYARISRSPRSVEELRELARHEVEKARQSNRNIVFEMGHSSIAEHAVFNIDVIGVSRLLVEEIEKFRLCSYTEKSQRYVLLKDDFVIPEEISRSGLEEIYVGTIREQNHFYHELYDKLRPYVFEKNKDLAADPANRSMLEGWAKEDARYILSLAMETQLGMTINARNLELMLRRLAAHPLTEAQEYSRKLFEATKEVAPSLIRYTEATDYDRLTRQALKEGIKTLAGKKRMGKAPASDKPVRLIHATPAADDRITASLIHSSSNLPMSQCLQIASSLDRRDKKNLIKTAFRHMKAHDPVLRELENVDLHFELITSASCFAQVKRHRMATITGQEYDPSLGITIPPAIKEIGMDKQFRRIIGKTENAYERIKLDAPLAAGYILTNAHCKRISMKINARELYHIARLRGDRHAQWDIRETAEQMVKLGKKAMPLTLMLATGKDGFASLHDKVFRTKR